MNTIGTAARSINLYMVNAALLIVHEMDSAFWKEWELFGMPGGIQVFLILNLLLVLLVLCGLKELAQGSRYGPLYSLWLAGAGLLTILIHGYFLLKGRPEFVLPVSLGVLSLIFVVSSVQGIWALRAIRASGLMLVKEVR